MIWVSFLFIISTLAFAGTPTFLLSETKNSKSFDLNRDGKADYVENFREGVLVESLYDRDSDGKMDVQTLIDPESDVFKIVDIAATKKTPRKRISFWNHEIWKKTTAFVQIDRNNDGVWDHSYETSSDIDQKRELCGLAILAAGTTLASQAFAATQQLDDYIQTDYGYRIHKSCGDTPAKSWVVPAIRSALSDGLACLTRLSQEGMRGAARNLSALESILSTNNVQIICNETTYRWNGTSTLAHATTGPEEPERVRPLVHTGISVNPGFIAETRPTNAEQFLEFRRTMFHEQLHNLGNRHGVEPEISYTCETCCFPGARDASDKTAAACTVCGGDYSSITDPDYLRDITAYADATYSRSQAQDASRAYLRENPQDGLGFAYLAANTGGIFGPVGTEMARLLSTRTDLTPEAQAVLARASEFSTYEPQAAYRTGARIIAQAYITLYQSEDPAAALQFIRANIPALRMQIALRHGENGEYMAGNLKESLDDLLSEVWYRGYRGASPAVVINGGRGDALTTEGLALKRELLPD
ncbi:MAG: hypothetical protein V4598_07460 [Bdellovibrionota bacterium]